VGGLLNAQDDFIAKTRIIGKTSRRKVGGKVSIKIVQLGIILNIAVAMW
jgi:hypothetical protein